LFTFFAFNIKTQDATTATSTTTPVHGSEVSKLQHIRSLIISHSATHASTTDQYTEKEWTVAPSAACKTALLCASEFVTAMLRPFDSKLSSHYLSTVELMGLYIERTAEVADVRTQTWKKLFDAKFAFHWLLKIIKTFDDASSMLFEHEEIQRLKYELRERYDYSDKSALLDSVLKIAQRNSSQAHLEKKRAEFIAIKKFEMTDSDAMPFLCIVLPFFKWRHSVYKTVDIRVLFNMLSENRMLLNASESYVVVHKNWPVRLVGNPKAPPLSNEIGAVSRQLPQDYVAVSLYSAMNVLETLQKLATDETLRIA
jgi:hypothetical protein